MGDDIESTVPNVPFQASSLVGQNEDGTKRFLGAEDPNNPPVPQERPPCVHGSDQCSHMQCPVCFLYFDFLVVGDDGKNVCDGCYKPIVRKV